MIYNATNIITIMLMICAMPALVIFMTIVILGGLLGILWLAEWIAEHIWGDDL